MMRISKIEKSCNVRQRGEANMPEVKKANRKYIRPIRKKIRSIYTLCLKKDFRE